MPAFLQTGASSSGLIGRDASEMSVSPAQNFSKPPPVPDVPTVIFTFGFSPWNASWAACANGATVLEPSILIVPERSPPVLRAGAAAAAVVVASACRRAQGKGAARGD